MRNSIYITTITRNLAKLRVPGRSSVILGKSTIEGMICTGNLIVRTKTMVLEY